MKYWRKDLKHEHHKELEIQNHPILSKQGIMMVVAHDLRKMKLYILREGEQH